ncbi:MAG TPA: chalcone isomerase family protein [Thermoanaerobaculia bacterium]|nr:chalcone isomerase family protein [Thermoanaerobaculia bacterium]
MRATAFALALALGATAFAPATAHAAELAGVTLPDSTRVGDQALVLNGAGLRSKFFVKVYVGGLYLPEKRGEAPVVLGADATRRMEMRFLRSVTSAQLCEGWLEGLEANTPKASADLRARFDDLCRKMEDVSEGTLLALTYTPGAGTEIAFGERAKGTIEGKDFADALLACWIGPEPGPGEDFKDGVLGR